MPRLDRRREKLDPANLVGERVRDLRHMRGHSQGDLAGAVQAELVRMFPSMNVVLDQSDLSRIESGVRTVSDFELRALAVVLAATADILLGLSHDSAV